MSEFLAEARVIVRPDTTAFRPQLIAQLAVATKGVTVPIAVTPVVTATGAVSAAAQTSAVSAALRQQSADLGVVGAATEKANQKTKDFNQTQSDLRKGVIASAGSLTGLRGAVLSASSPFLVAVIGITAFTKAVQSAADLETDLNVFRVTARATGEEMANVREQAKLLGRDLTLPGVTASDAAETFLTLSRAGLSVQDSLEGARGTLQLAVAAQIGFADAAQLTASALNAFGLSGDEAVAIADTLTNAANASQASISEMGIALRQSAAIADLAGFSFSETATFLTQLARQGLIGSDAGTSFRVSIQRLIAPTDKARQALTGLRINLRDVQGNLRPEAFFELGEALERMGRAQGDATRQLIFGNDASRAAAFLARLNAQSFREQERALNRAGAAAEQAGARNEGLAGKLENAKNQLAAFGVEIGELSIPAVGLAADVAAGFFGTLATQIAASREAIGDLAEDAEKLGDAFTQVSDDSGMTRFLDALDAAAVQTARDVEHASDVVVEFAADLLGIGGGASNTTTAIKGLTDEQIRLAKATTDSHDRFQFQIEDLKTVTTAAQDAAGAIGRLTGQIAGLEEGVTRARIAGDEGAEFELLEQERARLQRLLAIQENIVAQGGTGAATARRKIRAEILPQLESVNNEIRAILAEQVSETKALADDAKRATAERDKNIIDAISAGESRRSNALIRAQVTASLADDITAQVSLRNFYRRSIEEVRKTVRDAKLAAQIIGALTGDLIRANQEIADLKRQQREAARAERAEARERQRESLSLDVQIAEATGNRAAEIRARNAEIESLKEQIRQTRRGSNQRKRLILELRQAQAELKELQSAAKDTADARKTAAEFFFSQLQVQQGFAANLLGNLITGPTAGLVGVPSPPSPGAGVQQAAAKAAGERQTSPTSGQANAELNVLQRILDELRRLNGSYDAPEAINQKKSGSGSMDIAVM